MTTPPKPHADERGDPVDRYLDDLMSPGERSEFEARVAADPNLAAQIKRQQAVDEALHRYAQPPSPAAVLAAIRATSDSAGLSEQASEASTLRIRPLTTVRRLAVAAVLLMGLFGAWQVVQVMTAGPDGHYDVGPHRTLVQAYQDTVDAGFRSDWTCRDDAEFALTFHGQFGQMLSMNPPLPVNTEALGLEYFHILSRKTIGMLTRVDNQPVMIFIDRLENDAGPPPGSQGLSVFRRELGELVLYEVSPRSEAGLINHLRQPESLPSDCDPETPEH